MKRAFQYAIPALVVLLGAFAIVGAILFSKAETKNNFSVAETNCESQLQEAESCQIYVRFSPKETGQATGTLLIETSDGDKTLSLAGTGTEPSARGTLEKGEASPSAKNKLQIGQSSRQLYTLKNEGSKTLVIKQGPRIHNQTQKEAWIYFALLFGIFAIAVGGASLFFVYSSRN